FQGASHRLLLMPPCYRRNPHRQEDSLQFVWDLVGLEAGLKKLYCIMPATFRFFLQAQPADSGVRAGLAVDSKGASCSRMRPGEAWVRRPRESSSKLILCWAIMPSSSLTKYAAARRSRSLIRHP